jgi:hypothetical protein
MVKYVKDKSRCCSRFLLEMERLLWGQMKFIFGVKDFFHLMGSLRFSWDNRRSKGAQPLVCLDKNYLPSFDQTH